MAERLVIDASIAAKWFLDDESDVDLATDILAEFLAGDIELHAPRVFMYEVCSLLAKACGGRRLTKADGSQKVRDLFALAQSIELIELEETSAVSSLEMSADFSKTFKDMTYLWLAEELDCQWCTADEKVLKGGSPAAFPIRRILILSTRRS